MVESPALARQLEAIFAEQSGPQHAWQVTLVDGSFAGATATRPSIAILRPSPGSASRPGSPASCTSMPSYREADQLQSTTRYPCKVDFSATPQSSRLRRYFM